MQPGNAIWSSGLGARFFANFTFTRVLLSQVSGAFQRPKRPNCPNCPKAVPGVSQGLVGHGSAHFIRSYGIFVAVPTIF